MWRRRITRTATRKLMLGSVQKVRQGMLVHMHSLTWSHGQASVEWGYSVNKEIEVENLLKHSLAA